MKQYRYWLTNTYTECQICSRYDIDIPHHTGIGIKRDDRYQIVLCIGCHRKVHNSLFSWNITPDLEEMKFIAEENWNEFNKIQAYDTLG